MRTIAVIDSETDPFKRFRVPKPFIWGFYDGETFRLFKTTEALVEFLRDKPYVVYAHNGGRFDYHFLLGYIKTFDDLLIINGRIAQFRIGACEFRDSYNIIPVPLSQMQKDEISYDIFEEGEREKPDNYEKIIEYLRGDCVYLWNYVTNFVETYGFKITQASAAMRFWKKLSGREPPRSDKDYYDYFSTFYYGGRVQCFEAGVIDTHFEVYDINSAYAKAMKYRHPIGLDYDEFVGLPPNYHFLTNEEVGPMFFIIEGICKGAFPYREADGSLTFPNDLETRMYAVTGWEFRAALNTQRLLSYRVISTYVFRELTDFNEYIDYFYNLKLECEIKGDKPGRLFAKGLLTGLYGKFGSNPDEYNAYMVIPPEMIGSARMMGYEHAGEFGPLQLVQRELDDDEKRFYNVATAASITGFTRAYLWRAIHSCGPGNVLYCDTDSIATRVRGHRISVGDQLGQWKCEGQFDRAGIGGKKMYVFRGVKPKSGPREYKTASKGVDLSVSELWRVAKGEKVTYEFEAPTFSINKAPSFTHRNIVSREVQKRDELKRLQEMEENHLR